MSPSAPAIAGSAAATSARSPLRPLFPFAMLPRGGLLPGFSRRGGLSLACLDNRRQAGQFPGRPTALASDAVPAVELADQHIQVHPGNVAPRHRAADLPRIDRQAAELLRIAPAAPGKPGDSHVQAVPARQLDRVLVSAAKRVCPFESRLKMVSHAGTLHAAHDRRHPHPSPSGPDLAQRHPRSALRWAAPAIPQRPAHGPGQSPWPSRRPASGYGPRLTARTSSLRPSAAIAPHRCCGTGGKRTGVPAVRPLQTRDLSADVPGVRRCRARRASAPTARNWPRMHPSRWMTVAERNWRSRQG